MRITSPKGGARGNRRTISAGTSLTSAARRNGTQRQPVTAASKVMASMPAEKRTFTRQLQNNMRRVMGATNTSNIAARPDFIELLPLFTQNFLVPEVCGTIAMNSRQQLVPYFKVKTENAKGETAKGSVLSTPFVNRNGIDPNFGGRIVKNESTESGVLQYVPVLPYSVSVSDGTKTYTDNGAGEFYDTGGTKKDGAEIDYSTGTITGIDGTLTVTYQYDNETVGPDGQGDYGAKFGKIDLQLDEINLIAQAHELACYWSIYAAFAAQQEYGANIADLAKESAFAELTAEMNSQAFSVMADVAEHKPQFDWDASPVLSSAVDPQGYLQMFKLKLNQAANGIYQTTRLAQPNKLIVGSTVAAYIEMMNGFQSERNDDIVGPYRAGKLDQFDVYVDPNYDPNLWVMATKSNDIRRNAVLYGEYMPLMQTDPVTLGDLSTQSGYATMYAMEVVNPGALVSGRIVGSF